MKAYILRIKNHISMEYASMAASSCNALDINWEFFEGYQDMRGGYAWGLTGINLTLSEGRPFKWPKVANPPHEPNLSAGEKAECCTAGHAAIWKKIAEGSDKVAIILEHDAVMINPIDIEIPDGFIVVLGYKVTDPHNYDYKSAGPTSELIDIDGHEGAHAYAITKKTAQMMIKEIETKGRLGCVDNAYFIRHQRSTVIPLKIASPNAALGWIRKSTIWENSAAVNYNFISSFANYYK